MPIEKQEKSTDLEHEVVPVKSFTEDNIGTDDVLASIISNRGEKIGITGDVDEAMAIALRSKGVYFDEGTDKRLVWKIDLFLMPILCLLYSFQFMDKVSTSYAAVMGLTEDLHMVNDMYSWVGSSFYLGYLAFELPASYLLQRFPLSKVVSSFVILWGVCLCLHAAPNYAGFIFLRTVLGMLEASMTPAMVILTSQWYKAEEQFERTAIWFSFNGFGVILGSAIAYGLASHASSYDIAAWKILFIVIGLMTIVLGIVFIIHVPDTPASAWFLSDLEKNQVVERLRSNLQGFGNKHFKKYQFKEAMLDINTWLFFFYGLASDIPNGSLTNFGSILLSEDMGFSPVESLLMNMPSGAVEVVGCCIFGQLNKYVPHRLSIAITTTCVCLVAVCLLAFGQTPKIRLAGYYLQNIAPMGMICALSCFSSNTAGHTKKITCSAIFLIGYCVGNLIGPQTFIAKQAPQYKGGKISIVVTWVVSLVLLIWIYFNYYKENRRRNKIQDQISPNHQIDNIEFADLTDKENPNFRYRL